MSSPITTSESTRSGDRSTIRATATARSNNRLESGYGTSLVVSDGSGIVRDIHGLPVGVHVERLGSGLAPAGARIALAAERNMRLEAVGRPVHLDAAGDDPPDELLGTVYARGPDRRG